MKHYFNNFAGKKEMVRDLAKIYQGIMFSDIRDIELKKYRIKDGIREEEFIVLTWNNGAISTANNNINSISATARNVAKMLEVIYEALKVQLQKEVEQGDFGNVRHTAYSLQQIQKELDKWPKQGFSN